MMGGAQGSDSRGCEQLWGAEQADISGAMNGEERIMI